MTSDDLSDGFPHQVRGRLSSNEEALMTSDDL